MKYIRIRNVKAPIPLGSSLPESAFCLLIYFNLPGSRTVAVAAAVDLAHVIDCIKIGSLPPRDEQSARKGSFLRSSKIRAARGGTDAVERLKYSGVAGVAQKSPVKPMKTPAARIPARIRLVKVV